MDTKSWQVGDVSITCIIEQKMERQPEFGYRNLSTQRILEQAWLKPNFATPDGKLISCIQAFVIESQNKRIIVDTCVGNDKPRRGNPAWNMLQSSFLEDLTAAGFERESIDVVLCTHLHIDHVGWNTMLVDGRWMPTFPNAQYLFGRTEWEHWSQGTADAIAGDVKMDIAGTVLDTPAVNQDSIRPIIEANLHELVEMDHQITEDVRLEPTPGHTPGHVSVTIASGGDRAVITGDLMHHPIQCALPDVSRNFDHDVPRARDTRRDFLKRYADGEILVLGTHFATPTVSSVTATAGSFRSARPRPVNRPIQLQ